ncbi:methylmalonyl-CoA decarboxylase [Planctomycetota bacterium]|nr:methylmalonyl-CoA decarboxylase [Planctomycetota bacterium]
MIQPSKEKSPTTSMGVVELSIEDQVGYITMNDYKHRNRFSEQFSSAMLQAFIECEQSDCRVVVIQASPIDIPDDDQHKHHSRFVWSAGHDIHDFPTDQKSDPLIWEESYRQLTRQIRNSHLPVICAIQGSVWGAGCDLAACCDFIIATNDVTFAITPVKLGIPHNLVGVANFIHAFPDHMLKEIFLLAKPINAQTAQQFGFVNRIVLSKNLHSKTREFAEQLKTVAPLCVNAVKTEMNMLRDATAITTDQAEHLAAIRRRAYRSNDYIEGLSAFFEKRSPIFKGY